MEDKHETEDYQEDKPHKLEGNCDIKDFVYYAPDNKFIYTPNNSLWPPSAVNATVPPVETGIDDDGNPIFTPASKIIPAQRTAEQLTWAPGEPQFIKGKWMFEGGWDIDPKARVYNSYRDGPTIDPNPKTDVSKWLKHLQHIYPNDWQHIQSWLAFKTQNPGAKINHALVLGGQQGIGKDTILHPLRYAVGDWNFSEASPENIVGRFNPHLKAVILRINEARDLGDVNRFKFYEHMKPIIAAPPEVLRCDEKNMKQYGIPNVVGVIITTNHRTNGLYLPADDRRHYVAWSETHRDNFSTAYWDEMWRWLDEQGGKQAVAAYLNNLNLSQFDHKAPPPHTAAFTAMMEAGVSADNEDLQEVLEALDKPKAVTKEQLISQAEKSQLPELASFLRDRQAGRKLAVELDEAGYSRCNNPNAASHRWLIRDRKVIVYTRNDLPPHVALAAAKALQNSLNKLEIVR
ncbi:primase-helicase family protein [Microbulbifer sp. ALW1]|uniref:primase-helicase family protein n=1 Tax=Microbulbifer sp. (strain ALW1) TaxID=1516059 RepID=UPI00135C9431|nr:primase-helicase family protein [Microbulbifer sp. ALW1]